MGRNIVQLMTKKLANAVETLIAPSDKIRKILEGYQVSCPVEVIPSGIHLEKYQLCKKKTGVKNPYAAWYITGCTGVGI